MSTRPLSHTIFLMIPFILPLGMALDLYLPSMPSMADVFKANSSEIQLTMSIFLFTYGLGQLFIGPASDRFGRRKPLLASIILFICGSLLCTFSTSITMLLAGRVLQALGACGCQVITLARMRDLFEGKEATIIFTALKGATSLAPIAAPILGAFLQITYGWQANFIALSLFGIFIFILGFYVLKETHAGSSLPLLSQYIKPYHIIINKHPSFFYFSGCAIATQAAMFGYFSLSPRYFMIHFNLSEMQFAALFSGNAAIFLLTGLWGGKIVHHLGFYKATLLGACMLCLSGTAMFYGHYFFHHPMVLFLPNLIASSSAALMLGASTSGGLLPFKNTAGAASALLGCLEFMGGALIGSMAIAGENISVLPLASILTLSGFIILIAYFFLNRTQQLPKYNVLN